VKIAFLGPEGTFSEEALLTAIERSDLDPVPLPTIYDCVVAVQERRVERAFVPIENSLEGSVGATLDTLVFETDEVEIVGEVIHPVRHSLIARTELALEDIERVVSHPQANAQCARFLRERLSGAEVVAAPSTADAVRMVAETDAPWAALGTRLSAELNDCRVLLEGVEDHPDNETRFVWLGRGRPGESSPGPCKTSIVFWGLPDAPGALVEVLRAFADRGVNLSKIESRPLKQGLGRYIFFADLEGAEGDRQIAGAVDAVRSQVGTVRVLGSYPAARAIEGPTSLTG
jgi:prephenate dehydratase